MRTQTLLCTLCISMTLSFLNAQSVVINEFMASNDATVADQDGEYNDWIELYNNGTSSIDLEGYFLSDDATDLTQWTFPAGTVIEPGSYLMVWADNDEDQTGLHANFKLSASAESIFLLNASEEIIDEVSYVDQTTDISYGRYPNGTGNFQTMSPTFNATNSNTTSTSNPVLETVILKTFPNPAQDVITVSTDNELTMISIYNLAGQKILEQYPNQQETNINISQLVNGMYIIRALTKKDNIVTQKIIIEK